MRVVTATDSRVVPLSSTVTSWSGRHELLRRARERGVRSRRDRSGGDAAELRLQLASSGAGALRSRHARGRGSRRRPRRSCRGNRSACVCAAQRADAHRARNGLARRSSVRHRHGGDGRRDARRRRDHFRSDRHPRPFARPRRLLRRRQPFSGDLIFAAPSAASISPAATGPPCSTRRARCSSATHRRRRCIRSRTSDDARRRERAQSVPRGVARVTPRFEAPRGTHDILRPSSRCGAG